MQFGQNGLERTTIRSVAKAAKVDPALVMHYFGNKDKLFAEASRLDISPPDLSGVAPDFYPRSAAVGGDLFEVSSAMTGDDVKESFEVVVAVGKIVGP
ncbi:helix-turn-helix domain-containing protein [Mycobacterium sp. NPDC051804]|uniref:helix-turn-helix domain-containing protein n=1 Tax=Mycobacterium sp. NPDC051804 TaxID=3364295 RepID=UPI0037944FBE